MNEFSDKLRQARHGTSWKSSTVQVAWQAVMISSAGKIPSGFHPERGEFMSIGPLCGSTSPQNFVMIALQDIIEGRLSRIPVSRG